MVDIIICTPVASIGRTIFVPAGMAERKSSTAATAKAQCEAQCQGANNHRTGIGLLGHSLFVVGRWKERITSMYNHGHADKPL